MRSRHTQSAVVFVFAVAFSLAFLLAPAAPAREVPGAWQENPRWGYKLRVPKDWKRRTLKLDEPWIADKFFPDYELRGRAADGTFVTHKPDLWVIGFPHGRTARAGVHTEKVDEHTTVITVENPYKDYMDLVKRESWATTGQGGWYVSRQEKTEQDGHDVDVIEIKVEKLVVAPLRVLARVYHFDDVDIAVQVRILEEQVAENQRALDACLGSLREIPRTEPFPTEERPPVTPPKEDATKTIEEINAERLERVNARLEREIAHLPDGWHVQRSKHFVCLSQIDKLHTQYVLNYAEEIRDYLEDHFSELGQARVPPGLIRVFGSTDDEQAYQQGTRGWWVDEVGEITMTFARGADILGEFSWLAGRLTDQYFRIKNENLAASMPGWLHAGLWGHIEWARPSKRSRMVLAPTPSNIRALAQLFAAGKQLPLREVMTKSTDDYESWGDVAQAASVVYWLLNRGNKGKVKGALLRYLKSLDDIIKEEDERFEKEEEARWKAEAEAQAASGSAGKSEEELEREEDERYRERRQHRDEYATRLKAKASSIRERALMAAFGQLSDKDWEKLDKAWVRFAKP